jgi:hypothetical protein
MDCRPGISECSVLDDRLLFCCSCRRAAIMWMGCSGYVQEVFCLLACIVRHEARVCGREGARDSRLDGVTFFYPIFLMSTSVMT